VAKILVADDNSNIQKMVGLALKDQGIDVVAVGNGEAAVRKISDIRPDLVLADVFMPVRNGYEVCRYVKEDSSLAHIPVILLVGAFDPLDEQEAQRVGADGVLKKPFVPPDPLISMVKSALTRAGVPLGPAAAATEKTPVMPKRSTADLLSGGMGTKLTPVVPEKLPEISPEALEEFPPVTPHLKIAAGSEPLAFGSLLDTSDSEDMAITAKPMINLSQGSKWNEEEDEVEEEKEEGEETGGWRPGGLDEVIERAAHPEQAATPDWRDEAFHGTPPAQSFPATQWAPAVEKPEFAEAAESHSIAVATAPKPADSPVPFAGDAWAAAMAAGVEDKLAEVVAPLAPVAPEAEAAPEVHAAAAQETVAEAAPEVREQPAEKIANVAPGIDQGARAAEPASTSAFEQPPVSEPANWASAPEAAWEMEAKKAALLASTWDAPKPLSVDETQELPAYAAEPVVEHSENLVEDAGEQSAYSAEPIVAHEDEERVETAASETVVASEAPASEVATGAGLETAEAKTLETWEPEPPAAAVTQAEESVVKEAPVETLRVEEPVAVAPQVEEQPVVTAPPETAVAEPAVSAKLAEPDMDELVARVLGKMNPEVLQRVTREILKPVIEAIVRDEIDSKKS
jgi:CheY-like chemotaxis protein